MLAQSFMTAADLGITEEQRGALAKTLVLLETDKLIHAAPESQINWYSEDKFTGQFNMDMWTLNYEGCGTVACIGGTAELIGDISFGDAHHKLPENLYRLFYPGDIVDDWAMITTQQAARALRSYLTTGDARWDLALSSKEL